MRKLMDLWGFFEKIVNGWVNEASNTNAINKTK